MLRAVLLSGSASLHSFRLLLRISVVLRNLSGSVVLLLLCLAPVGAAETAVDQTRVFPLAPPPGNTGADFLIDPAAYRAGVYRSPDGQSVILQNGLIRRVWRLQPNAACVQFDNLMTGQSLLRAVHPEALVTIDGTESRIGGLTGQPNHAWLDPEWIPGLKNDASSWQLQSVDASPPTARLEWNQRRHHAPNVSWPPKGVTLTLTFVPPAARSEWNGISVSVHYTLYDGLPALSKWITVHNHTERRITVNRFRAEELAVVEYSSPVELRAGVTLPPPDCLHVETDFAFGGMTSLNSSVHTVSWQPDPQYTTQVNYLKQTPCLLTVQPTYGPEQDVEPQATFESFRVFELVYDDGNRERRGLMQRRLYRIVAPWVTENPITHHLLNSNPDRVLEAIDDAAAVGFEAIILSFGSGFNMENTDAGYLQRWTEVADYAQDQGIELGAYSLFSSRSVGGGNDVVSPEGQRPVFGKAPAATSEWGVNYYRTLREFFDRTGFDQFENDGPYPGDLDVTARPPLQKGGDDSRWAQWLIVRDLYRHLRRTGVYINQPDYYFLNGGSKTGMGYREVNWSLPRAQQVIHTRQNIYDGTWSKTPSMGWMFVPLAQYHGGGAAATIEPLHKHLDHYALMMHSNLGMGVQAHYRGPRLYDTDETRDQVRSIVTWFKQYRDILESDVLHGRRADGRELDWVLHANPHLPHKGMLCVWNPTPQPVSRVLTVDLYYTGLTEAAVVTNAQAQTQHLSLSRDARGAVQVQVPAGGMAWYLIESP